MTLGNQAAGHPAAAFQHPGAIHQSTLRSTGDLLRGNVTSPPKPKVAVARAHDTSLATRLQVAVIVLGSPCGGRLGHTL